MKTKIIDLAAILKRFSGYNKDVELTNHLAKAAWSIAHTFLWPGKEFSSDETDSVLNYLRHHFMEAINRKNAFINFCERIIVTSKLYAMEQIAPSVWFNEVNKNGFALTQDWHRQISRKRKDTPGYLSHLAVLAKYYYHYSLSPSARIFRMCRKKLLKLKAHRLLQQFNNTIVHYHYLVP